MEDSRWKRIFSFPKNLPFFRFSMLSVGLRAIASIGLNKWVAVAFGPVGTALFSQFIHFFALFSTVSTEGLARGMVREGAYHNGSQRDTEVHSVVGSGLVILGGILALEIVLWLGINQWTQWVSPFSAHLWWILPAFSALTFAFFSSNFFLVRGQTQFQTILITCISFGALAGWGLARFLNLEITESFLLLTLGQISIGLLFLFLFWPKLSFKIRQFSWQSALAKKIMVLTAVVSITSLFSKMADYGLITWAMDFHGKPMVGIWMAMNRIADSFNIPILAVVNAILLPLIAGKSDQPDAIGPIMKPLMRQLFFWTFIGLVLLYFGYPVFLRFLFSADFQSTATQTLFQLTGDFFKTNSTLISGLCLGLGATRFYLWLELSSVAFLVLATLALSHWLGETGLFAAHCLRYALFWGCLLFRFRQFLI